eukprot:gnl/MRDRNA2_/MRDRNA2_71057_c0_seq3.p1 gnl/MRDRNA2_/MRDRNA2_71057_c0~~gnl/MRDRNA2_/MRDRNA2_71057_c0_seq3.p1  ORF type:complete len:563 (-),score=80.58 gnl/MRDRNA2_/MRDRNA2_71057_c0_seq3:414-2102(-)
MFCPMLKVRLRHQFYTALSGILAVMSLSAMLFMQVDVGSIERSDPRVCSVHPAPKASILRDAADALRRLRPPKSARSTSVNISVNKFRKLKRTNPAVKRSDAHNQETDTTSNEEKEGPWWKEIKDWFDDDPEEPPKKKSYTEPFQWACAHKVRKDWNDLTDSEKSLYLDAVNALKSTPRKGAPDNGPGNNIYDTFVLIHGESANKKYAHQTAGFLSWHRKFLLEFEDALRTVDKRFQCVTVPYWDWSSEMWECRKKSVKLNQAPCDTYHGASELLSDFGGPGDPRTVYQNTWGSSGVGKVGCVTTGPFAGWIDHNGRCLSRGVNWRIRDQKPFTGRARLSEIVQMPDFGDSRGGFRVVLEGTPHGATHNFLGGHMRSFISPADPIFFSHHCYIDKIWAVWQDCHDYDVKEITGQLKEDGENPRMYKYYKPTKIYDDDSITDPMIFRFPFGRESMISKSRCRKTVHECASCVHPQDSWCKANNWDMLCRAQCVDHCSDVCSGDVRATMSLHVRGKEIMDHWVLEEVTPASMHSVHELGERSYTYAPDEFERHLNHHVPELLGG